MGSRTDVLVFRRIPHIPDGAFYLFSAPAIRGGQLDRPAERKGGGKFSKSRALAFAENSNTFGSDG